MPNFHYDARDIEGQIHHGSIKARDAAGATMKLRRRGLFPTLVRGTALTLPPRSPRRPLLQRDLTPPAFLRAVRAKELTLLTRQLATLIHAGLPLARALDTLQRQHPNPAARDTLAAVGGAIAGGSSFADALAERRRVFDHFYIHMVRAGEAAGRLDHALERLAIRMEKARRLRRRVQGAMAYPCVVMATAAAILVFMMVAIIPRFELLFADLLEGRSLPAPTRFVMGLSQQLQAGWPLWLAAAAGTAALAALLKRFRRGRAALDRLKLSTPYLGGLARLAALGRFARSLGTLMEAGVPILHALEITKETLGNELLERAVEKVRAGVREGGAMAAALEADPLFPPVFGSMVGVGEETGDLPAMLLKTADMYEEEVDGAVATLSSIIEPMMIVMLSLVVGTIVVAMFLPMVSIIGNLG